MKLDKHSALEALEKAYSLQPGGMHSPCISLDLRTGTFDLEPRTGLTSSQLCICGNVDCWDGIGLDAVGAAIMAEQYIYDLLDDAERAVDEMNR